MHKHSAKRHPEMVQAIVRDDENRKGTKVRLARDRYTTTVPSRRGPPIGGVGEWMSDQANQGLWVSQMVPFENPYDLPY